MLALHYRPRRTDQKPREYGPAPRITAGASSYVGPTPQLVRPNASKHRADNANKYRAKRPARRSKPPTYPFATRKTGLAVGLEPTTPSLPSKLSQAEQWRLAGHLRDLVLAQM